MSILNLNAPQGRGPIGKKSAKIWMGVGLLAAVLGFGSTFAANITLNSPEGTSEFGQGVTQTIYCGADEPTAVKVTPASKYTNATTTKSFNNAQFIGSFSSGSGGTTSVSPVTIYGSASSNTPRFTSNTSARIGWWLSGSSTTSTPASPQPSIEQVYANPSAYWFTEKNSDGTFKKPASSPAVRSSTSTDYMTINDEGSNFKLEKVVISNIPASCSGVDLVVSSYGSSGDAKTLSGSTGSGVTSVAVLWNANSVTTYPSKDRTTFSTTKVSSTCLVSSEQTSNSLTLTFATPNITAKDLNKLVVETQEDAIGVGQSCSSSS
ncbi:hypothetical protein MCEMZLE2_01045 [Candidatus Nanopelagicaceae bacterium]